MIPSKRDIDRASVLLNGLTDAQREELLTALKASSSHRLAATEELFFPFCQGYLLGLLTARNER
jgi:hypothetical protein